MRVLKFLSICVFLTSCKSQKTSCDAYAKQEIKKDHQI